MHIITLCFLPILNGRLLTILFSTTPLYAKEDVSLWLQDGSSCCAIMTHAGNGVWFVSSGALSTVGCEGYLKHAWDGSWRCYVSQFQADNDTLSLDEIKEVHNGIFRTESVDIIQQSDDRICIRAWDWNESMTDIEGPTTVCGCKTGYYMSGYNYGGGSLPSNINQFDCIRCPDNYISERFSYSDSDCIFAGDSDSTGKYVYDTSDIDTLLNCAINGN